MDKKCKAVSLKQSFYLIGVSTIKAYKKTEDFEAATHWEPTHDQNNIDWNDITFNKMYEFVYYEPEDEWVIVDDKGIYSLIYLCHSGELYEEVDE